MGVTAVPSAAVRTQPCKRNNTHHGGRAGAVVSGPRTAAYGGRAGVGGRAAAGAAAAERSAQPPGKQGACVAHNSQSRSITTRKHTRSNNTESLVRTTASVAHKHGHIGHAANTCTPKTQDTDSHAHAHTHTRTNTHAHTRKPQTLKTDTRSRTDAVHPRLPRVAIATHAKLAGTQSARVRTTPQAAQSGNAIYMLEPSQAAGRCRVRHALRVVAAPLCRACASMCTHVRGASVRHSPRYHAAEAH
jgi:hypothetical protein